MSKYIATIGLILLILGILMVSVTVGLFGVLVIAIGILIFIIEESKKSNGNN